jgi:tryptophan-rich sensory protein
MKLSGAKAFTEGARALRHSPPRVRPTSAGSLPPLTAGIVALTVVGVAALVAVSQPSTRDDPDTERWYDNLDKSVATPPDVVFGVVWPLIEAASAYAGFRLLTRRSGVKRNSALGFLGFNLALIPAFTKLFFGDRNLRGATLSSMSLFAGAWGFVVTAWRADRQAALAGLPLAAWVTFANYLQEEILRRNDPEVRQRAARMAGL